MQLRTSVWVITKARLDKQFSNSSYWTPNTGHVYHAEPAAPGQLVHDRLKYKGSALDNMNVQHDWYSKRKSVCVTLTMKSLLMTGPS